MYTTCKKSLELSKYEIYAYGVMEYESKDLRHVTPRAELERYDYYGRKCYLD
jgi:hypothetical protein